MFMPSLMSPTRVSVEQDPAYRTNHQIAAIGRPTLRSDPPHAQVRQILTTFAERACTRNTMPDLLPV